MGGRRLQTAPETTRGGMEGCPGVLHPTRGLCCGDPGAWLPPKHPGWARGGGWGPEKGTPRDVGGWVGSWKFRTAPNEGEESRVRGPRRECPRGVDARGGGTGCIGGVSRRGRTAGGRRWRSPNSSSFTSRAAFSPSSRRLRSIMRERSAAALSSALTVQPMAAAPRSALCRHCPALRGAGGAGRSLGVGRGFDQGAWLIWGRGFGQRAW